MKFDVVLIGVGGQGILTVGDILAQAALVKGIPMNFLPSKGMAQRGGFVKAELRLGDPKVGPRIPQRSADLVIATERSEALKGVGYIKTSADFLLYNEVLSPAGVLLGKAEYPDFELVQKEVRNAGARLIVIDPGQLPRVDGMAVPANIFVLGVAVGKTGLGQVFDAAEIADVLRDRWKRDSERNLLAFRAGLECI